MTSTPFRPWNIEFPPPNVIVDLDTNGEITSVGTYDVEGEDQIWAKCFGAGDPVVGPSNGDSVGPPGSVRILDVNTGDWQGTVPAAACRIAPTALTQNDNVLVVWQRFGGDNEWREVDRKSFKGRMPASFTTRVFARHCLYYAFAPAEFSGPRGEAGEHGRGVYRPRSLPVPADRTGVQFTASGLWRHSPGNGDETGPEGEDNTEETVAGYVHADYGSQNLSVDDLGENRLNLFVGMWSVDWAAGKMFAIGTSTNRFDAEVQGTPAKKLYLGMHDGWEWDNNHGSLSVDVQWLA